MQKFLLWVALCLGSIADLYAHDAHAGGLHADGSHAGRTHTRAAGDSIVVEFHRRDSGNHLIVHREKIDPATVGVVIIDMWNWHWCETNAARDASMVPRMNKCLEGARKLGMQVLWCPTDVANNYVGTPQRERALATPRLPLPPSLNLACPHPSVGDCMCGGDPDDQCMQSQGWYKMADAFVIGDSDLIAKGPQEIYSICKARGITRLFYMGINTNICVLDKPEGMRNMMNYGMQCALVGDLQDPQTSYDPLKGITPDTENARILAHFEKYLAPSLNFKQLLEMNGLWDESWIVDPVRITPWGKPDRPHQFKTSQIVTLTTPFLPDGQTYYTLDGSAPNEHSLLYARPFTLTATTTVRAIAYKDGRPASLESTGYFVKLPPTPPLPDVWLDPSTILTENKDNREPVLDKCIRGTPLKIRNIVYARGVGTQAPSTLAYAIKPAYRRFVGQCGMDDCVADDNEGKEKTAYVSAVFKVIVDGKTVAQSPVMRTQVHPWSFDVALPPGSRVIDLVAEGAGINNIYNYADWINAGFVTGASAASGLAGADTTRLTGYRLLEKDRDIRIPETDAHYNDAPYADSIPDSDYPHASVAAYEAFNDMKFGVRIHWGIYSIWQMDHESWGFLKLSNEKKQEYMNLYKTFNPTGFNAEEWMTLFERSGIKCMAFTTKHHEGFSMWDTRTRVKRRANYTAPGGPKIEDCDVAYSIMETPFHRDVVKELCDAAHRHNIRIDLYFSHPDWYDADFRPYNYHPLQTQNSKDSGLILYGAADNFSNSHSDIITPAPTDEERARMMARHRQQLTELLTNYGKIDMMCLDQWLGPLVWPEMKETIKELRKIQPDVMLRARGIGNYGDYYTPEGFTPGNKENTHMPWMVINTLGSSFSYDKVAAHYKGSKWIIDNLVDAVAKGGSFMVGIGPDGTGRFHPAAVRQLLETGKWLRVNGVGIYATRARDVWKEGENIRFTRTKDWRYTYAFDLVWPGSQLVLTSVRPVAGSSIFLLGYPKPLHWTYSDGRLVISLPAALQNPAARPCVSAWGFRIEEDGASGTTAGAGAAGTVSATVAGR